MTISLAKKWLKVFSNDLTFPVDETSSHLTTSNLDNVLYNDGSGSASYEVIGEFALTSTVKIAITSSSVVVTKEGVNYSLADLANLPNNAGFHVYLIPAPNSSTFTTNPVAKLIIKSNELQKFKDFMDGGEKVKFDVDISAKEQFSTTVQDFQGAIEFKGVNEAPVFSSYTDVDGVANSTVSNMDESEILTTNPLNNTIYKFKVADDGTPVGMNIIESVTATGLGNTPFVWGSNPTTSHFWVSYSASEKEFSIKLTKLGAQLLKDLATATTDLALDFKIKIKDTGDVVPPNIFNILSNELNFKLNINGQLAAPSVIAPSNSSIKEYDPTGTDNDLSKNTNNDLRVLAKFEIKDNDVGLPFNVIINSVSSSDGNTPGFMLSNNHYSVGSIYEDNGKHYVEIKLTEAGELYLRQNVGPTESKSFKLTVKVQNPDDNSFNEAITTISILGANDVATTATMTAGAGGDIINATSFTDGETTFGESELIIQPGGLFSFFTLGGLKIEDADKIEKIEDIKLEIDGLNYGITLEPGDYKITGPFSSDFNRTKILSFQLTKDGRDKVKAALDDNEDLVIKASLKVKDYNGTESSYEHSFIINGETLVDTPPAIINATSPGDTNADNFIIKVTQGQFTGAGDEFYRFRIEDDHPIIAQSVHYPSNITFSYGNNQTIKLYLGADFTFDPTLGSSTPTGGPTTHYYNAIFKLTAAGNTKIQSLNGQAATSDFTISYNDGNNSISKDVSFGINSVQYATINGPASVEMNEVNNSGIIFDNAMQSWSVSNGTIQGNPTISIVSRSDIKDALTQLPSGLSLADIFDLDHTSNSVSINVSTSNSIGLEYLRDLIDNNDQIKFKIKFDVVSNSGAPSTIEREITLKGHFDSVDHYTNTIQNNLPDETALQTDDAKIILSTAVDDNEPTNVSIDVTYDNFSFVVKRFDAANPQGINVPVTFILGTHYTYDAATKQFTIKKDALPDISQGQYYMVEVKFDATSNFDGDKSSGNSVVLQIDGVGQPLSSPADLAIDETPINISNSLAEWNLSGTSTFPANYSMQDLLSSSLISITNSELTDNAALNLSTLADLFVLTVSNGGQTLSLKIKDLLAYNTLQSILDNNDTSAINFTVKDSSGALTDTFKLTLKGIADSIESVNHVLTGTTNDITVNQSSDAAITFNINDIEPGVLPADITYNSVPFTFTVKKYTVANPGGVDVPVTFVLGTHYTYDAATKLFTIKKDALPDINAGEHYRVQVNFKAVSGFDSDFSNNSVVIRINGEPPIVNNALIVLDPLYVPDANGFIVYNENDLLTAGHTLAKINVSDNDLITITPTLTVNVANAKEEGDGTDPLVLTAIDHYEIVITPPTGNNRVVELKLTAAGVAYIDKQLGLQGGLTEDVKFNLKIKAIDSLGAESATVEFNIKVNGANDAPTSSDLVSSQTVYNYGDILSLSDAAINSTDYLAYVDFKDLDDNFFGLINQNGGNGNIKVNVYINNGPVDTFTSTGILNGMGIFTSYFKLVREDDLNITSNNYNEYKYKIVFKDDATKAQFLADKIVANGGTANIKFEFIARDLSGAEKTFVKEITINQNGATNTPPVFNEITNSADLDGSVDTSITIKETDVKIGNINPLVNPLFKVVLTDNVPVIDITKIEINKNTPNEGKIVFTAGALTLPLVVGTDIKLSYSATNPSELNYYIDASAQSKIDTFKASLDQGETATATFEFKYTDAGSLSDTQIYTIKINGEDPSNDDSTAVVSYPFPMDANHVVQDDALSSGLTLVSLIPFDPQGVVSQSVTISNATVSGLSGFPYTFAQMFSFNSLTGEIKVKSAAMTQAIQDAIDQGEHITITCDLTTTITDNSQPTHNTTVLTKSVSFIIDDNGGNQIISGGNGGGSGGGFQMLSTPVNIVWDTATLDNDIYESETTPGQDYYIGSFSITDGSGAILNDNFTIFGGVTPIADFTPGNPNSSLKISVANWAGVSDQDFVIVPEMDAQGISAIAFKVFIKGSSIDDFDLPQNAQKALELEIEADNIGWNLFGSDDSFNPIFHDGSSSSDPVPVIVDARHVDDTNPDFFVIDINETDLISMGELFTFKVIDNQLSTATPAVVVDSITFTYGNGQTITLIKGTHFQLDGLVSLQNGFELNMTANLKPEGYDLIHNNIGNSAATAKFNISYNDGINPAVIKEVTINLNGGIPNTLPTIELDTTLFTDTSYTEAELLQGGVTLGTWNAEDLDGFVANYEVVGVGTLSTEFGGLDFGTYFEIVDNNAFNQISIKLKPLSPTQLQTLKDALSTGETGAVTVKVRATDNEGAIKEMDLVVNIVGNTPASNTLPTIELDATLFTDTSYTEAELLQGGVTLGTWNAEDLDGFVANYEVVGVGTLSTEFGGLDFGTYFEIVDNNAFNQISIKLKPLSPTQLQTLKDALSTGETGAVTVKVRATDNEGAIKEMDLVVNIVGNTPNPANAAPVIKDILDADVTNDYNRVINELDISNTISLTKLFKIEISDDTSISAGDYSYLSNANYDDSVITLQGTGFSIVLEKGDPFLQDKDFFVTKNIIGGKIILDYRLTDIGKNRIINDPNLGAGSSVQGTLTVKVTDGVNPVQIQEFVLKINGDGSINAKPILTDTTAADVTYTEAAGNSLDVSDIVAKFTITDSDAPAGTTYNYTTADKDFEIILQVKNAAGAFVNVAGQADNWFTITKVGTEYQVKLTQPAIAALKDLTPNGDTSDFQFIVTARDQVNTALNSAPITTEVWHLEDNGTSIDVFDGDGAGDATDKTKESEVTSGGTSFVIGTFHASDDAALTASNFEISLDGTNFTLEGSANFVVSKVTGTADEWQIKLTNVGLAALKDHYNADDNPGTSEDFTITVSAHNTANTEDDTDTFTWSLEDDSTPNDWITVEELHNVNLQQLLSNDANFLGDMDVFFWVDMTREDSINNTGHKAMFQGNAPLTVTDGTVAIDSCTLSQFQFGTSADENNMVSLGAGKQFFEHIQAIMAANPGNDWVKLTKTFTLYEEGNPTNTHTETIDWIITENGNSDPN